MEKNTKFSRTAIALMILCVLMVVAFFLPLSTGNGMFSFSGDAAYNVIDVIGFIFDSSVITTSTMLAFQIPFIMSCIGLVLVLVAVVVLFVMTIRRTNVSVRRVLAVCILFTTLFMGFLFNTSLTSVAKEVTAQDEKTGVTKVVKESNNFYNVYPEFKIKMEVANGSANKWKQPILKFKEVLSEVFPAEEIPAVEAKLDELYTYADQYGYGKIDSSKEYKKANQKILTELQALIEVEEQEMMFETYFGSMTKSVSAVSSTFGVGYLLAVFFAVIICGLCYSERSAEGYKNNGIPANCMYVGIGLLIVVLALVYPMFKVETLTTGLTGTSLLVALCALPKVLNLTQMGGELGINVAELNQGMMVAGLLCLVLALASIMVFVVMAARKKCFKLRRAFSIAGCVLLILGGAFAGAGFGESGISMDIMYFLVVGISIGAALIPFTVYQDKERYKVFSVINVILFLLICAFIIVPLWKVLVDSLDAQAGYGLRMWPKEFSLEGYRIILSTETMRKPFLISVLTTVCGTCLGLLISTLGAYVLIQFDMPGRNFLAGLLLFTMIFQAGIIPVYLVMTELHLTNTLWIVILMPAINVYNLVLMRNFFEGIPKSLFESASIDGCTPMGTFIKIVLPLSKAALASIGLMFAVSYWNDYTNYKLYITNTSIHNFQMKLRALFFSSDLPEAGTGANTETLKNASIMVAILPFMIAYPFLQKYFVKGVNVGAVKE